jgi:hypothetical protein
MSALKSSTGELGANIRDFYLEVADLMTIFAMIASVKEMIEESNG